MIRRIQWSQLRLCGIIGIILLNLGQLSQQPVTGDVNNQQSNLQPDIIPVSPTGLPVMNMDFYATVDYALFNNGSIFGEPVFALVGVFVFPVFEWCLEHILVTYKYIGLVCIQGLDLLK